MQKVDIESTNAASYANRAIGGPGVQMAIVFSISLTQNSPECTQRENVSR